MMMMMIIMCFVCVPECALCVRARVSLRDHECTHCVVCACGAWRALPGAGGGLLDGLKGSGASACSRGWTWTGHERSLERSSEMVLGRVWDWFGTGLGRVWDWFGTGLGLVWDWFWDEFGMSC